MQKRLEKLALDEVTKAGEVASCAKAWLDLEWYKREVRGRPRLKAVDAVTMLRDAAARRALSSAASRVPTEIDVETAPETAPTTPKESTNGQTVTAPPPAEPPIAN
jgi:hypothetical protein